jgi:hypothetical protein
MHDETIAVHGGRRGRSTSGHAAPLCARRPSLRSRS